MKAARWLGQRDRFNIDVDIDGVPYTVELQAIAVHVEPDKVHDLYASMSVRFETGVQTINDLALSEICKRINGDG